MSGWITLEAACGHRFAAALAHERTPAFLHRHVG